MPNESKKDIRGVFFEEKASCLPNIIQFTTISGMYGPRDLLISGKNAFKNKSHTVTNVAITTVNVAMRTCGGTIFLIRDITTEVEHKTNITANPMEAPFTKEVVTASVGHIPRSCLKIGWSLHRPFRNTAI
jgi:hypothetical protein